MEHYLEIKNLHVEYHTDDNIVYAVNGVDLYVDKGETLGLVGETGAGKTTTALSIMRLLPERVGFITAGSIQVDGKEVTKAKEADMRIIRGDMVSMIFQDPMTSLNPIIPVGEQIEEVLLLHTKMSKEERSSQVDRILESVGLQPSRKNEYPHQFSGGMRQRIVIAMALACEPGLLLADEPTTALDVTIQAQVLRLMNELKNKMNMGMLLITHDLGVVAQTCDRVAIMYGGKIIEQGLVKDIYESEEHHPYTRGRCGSIPERICICKRLSPIPGLVADPTVKYPGCSFADRCPHAQLRCREGLPETWCSGTHEIRCWLYAGAEGA